MYYICEENKVYKTRWDLVIFEYCDVPGVMEDKVTKSFD